MINLNDEYELFKSLCNSNCVKCTHKNEDLLKRIEAKGLKISKNEEICKLQNSIIPLSEEVIRNGLDPIANESIQMLDILYQTASTNKTITDTSLSDRYSVLLTECQTDGQGRRDKKWLSPLAENIYMSIQFKLIECKNAHLIPLITALSICQTLKKQGMDGCQIKWPNDIYFKGKKLAGILVESRYNLSQGSIFVVGIGLNVNMQINTEIDQLWTSMRNSQKQTFDRNIIISTLLSDALASYNKINKMDLTQFMVDWQLYDYLYGSEITITDDKNSYVAVSHGIANDGSLLIEVPGDRSLKKIYSADVSIKSNKDV